MRKMIDIISLWRCWWRWQDIFNFEIGEGAGGDSLCACAGCRSRRGVQQQAARNAASPARRSPPRRRKPAAYWGWAWGASDGTGLEPGTMERWRLGEREENEFSRWDFCQPSFSGLMSLKIDFFYMDLANFRVCQGPYGPPCRSANGRSALLLLGCHSGNSPPNSTFSPALE